MPKRLRYLISSVLSGITFFLFITLPFEARYYALMVEVVLLFFFYWFGLGIIWEKSMYFKIVPVLMPLGWFVGFGLFLVILPLPLPVLILMSLLFGIVCYFIFLVENIFFVAIGYKTVPLYRAAYTTSLILLLGVAFFLFDSLLSFKFNFIINGVATLIVSMGLFLYNFWAVTIDSEDDGKSLNMFSYVAVPSIIMSQMAVAFSFWPVGVFKGSIFLVLVIYIITGLLQADMRGRLFKKTWTGYLWVGVAILLAIVLLTRWR